MFGLVNSECLPDRMSGERLNTFANSGTRPGTSTRSGILHSYIVKNGRYSTEMIIQSNLYYSFAPPLIPLSKLIIKKQYFLAIEINL